MSSSTSPQQTQQRGRVDDRLGTSTRTAQTGALPQTRLANIPAQFIQEACEFLAWHIRPEYDDNRIQRSLDHVRHFVQRALKHDPNLKRHLADESKFLENVKNRPGGEQGFIKSLRDMAKDNSWERLFEDGTSFFSLALTTLIILYLDVFITLKEDSGTPPELIRGARPYQILYISFIVSSSLQPPNARGVTPFEAMLNLSFLRPSPISSTETDLLMQD